MTLQQPALPEEESDMAEEAPVNHRSTLLARLFRMNVANLSAVDKAAAAASAQWPLQGRASTAPASRHRPQAGHPGINRQRGGNSNQNPISSRPSTSRPSTSRPYSSALAVPGSPTHGMRASFANSIPSTSGTFPGAEPAKQPNPSPTSSPAANNDLPMPSPRSSVPLAMSTRQNMRPATAPLRPGSRLDSALATSALPSGSQTARSDPATVWAQRGGRTDSPTAGKSRIRPATAAPSLHSQAAPMTASQLATAQGGSAAAAAAASAEKNGSKVLQLGVSMAVLWEYSRKLDTRCCTREVVSRYIIPATAATMCRMADVLVKEASMAHKVEGEGLGRQVLGVPEFYVSHSWSANFHTLIGSLHTHFTIMGRALAGVFVWMDIMCINQHPAKMRKELPRLKEVICRCKYTLLFLDPAADALLRMWCLYEVWHTIAVAGASKLKLLGIHCDWDSLTDVFFRFDIRTANVSMAEDAPKLLEDLSNCLPLYGSAPVKEGSSGAAAAAAAATAAAASNGMGSFLGAGSSPARVNEAIRRCICESGQNDLLLARRAREERPDAYLVYAEQQALLLVVQSRLNEAEDTLMETLKAVLPHANMMRTLQARQLARYTTRSAAQPSSQSALQPRTHRQPAAAALTASGSFKANSTASPEHSVRASHAGQPRMSTAGSVTQGRMSSSGAKVAAARNRARISNAAGNDDIGGPAGEGGEDQTHFNFGGGGSAPASAVAASPGHTASAKNHLAKVLKEQGRLVQASQLSTSVLYSVPGLTNKGNEAWLLTPSDALSMSHIDAMWNAADIQHCQGRHESAVQLAQHVYWSHHLRSGPSDINTIRSICSLSRNLLAGGRIADALAQAQAALALSLPALGDSHLMSAACYHALSRVLLAQSKLEEAFVANDRSLRICKQQLGHSHPVVMDGMEVLAAILEAGQEYRKAVEVMRLVVEGRSKGTSSGSSALLLEPLNRLLHLRVMVALTSRSSSKLDPYMLYQYEAQLKLAISPSMQVRYLQRDLEQVLLALGKKLEATMVANGQYPWAE